MCLVYTKYESIDDDSRYRGANQEAKNHIDEEIRCEGNSDSKHSLKSDGQQQDETSAVPSAEEEEVFATKLSMRMWITDCDSRAGPGNVGALGEISDWRTPTYTRKLSCIPKNFWTVYRCQFLCNQLPGSWHMATA